MKDKPIHPRSARKRRYGPAALNFGVWLSPFGLKPPLSGEFGGSMPPSPSFGGPPMDLFQGNCELFFLGRDVSLSLKSEGATSPYLLLFYNGRIIKK